MRDIFYAILQKCSELESLKIAKLSGETSIDDFVPPEGVCREKLRESLSRLRHLNLEIELTADILDLLLGLMPNVTSIHLSYYFDKDSDFLERLPTILRKNQIIRTGADFRLMRSTSDDVIKLADGTLGTLGELRMKAETLTEAAVDAILRCTTLRILTLKGFETSFNSSDLDKLVSNFPPDLEILELHFSAMFEFGDMRRLLEFNKVRTLSLISPYLNQFTDESLRSFEGMSTLVSLNLQGFDIDSEVIRRLGCLKNLRTLDLKECPDSECFEAICENFGRLTELNLGDVENLSDADGSKLCGFKELRCLSFFDGYGFTDEAFKRGVGSRDMKSLYIGGCSITDDGLRSLASHHNRLESITLFSNRNITSAGVLALLRNKPRLKCFLTEVPLPPLRSLRDVCPRLRRL